ncbi:MAG: M24 family metallopeptidase, partial [Caldilinea sp.]
MFDYSQRLARVQQAMADHGIDLLFLNASTNLQYLTGIARDEPNYGNTMYPGEWLTGAWVPQQGAPILTLPRMLADFHLGAIPGYDVRVLPDAGDALALARDVLMALHTPENARIAVDDRAWAELVLNVQKLRPAATLSQASAILVPIRRIKSEDEIAVMRKAGEITEAAYAATLKQLKHGMTNLDLITEVNYQLRKHGSRAPSFVTAFYNMGRHYPFDFTNREEVLQIPLKPPVSVSFDFGAVYEGYCYDFGRSIFFGEPDEEYRRVH